MSVAKRSIVSLHRLAKLWIAGFFLQEYTVQEQWFLYRTAGLSDSYLKL